MKEKPRDLPPVSLHGEEIAARELAEDYHRVTEEFDRTVCTGPIRNGSIRPSCVAELYTINRFARQAYANRLEMAIAKGATPKQFQKAVAVAVHRMQNPTGLRCAGLDAHKQDPVVLPPDSENHGERK